MVIARDFEVDMVSGRIATLPFVIPRAVTFLISHKNVLSIKRVVVDGKGASPPPQ
jgi:hypothetical protein